MHFKLEIAADGINVEFTEYERETCLFLQQLTPSRKVLVDTLSGSTIIEIGSDYIEVPFDCDRQIFYRRRLGEAITISSDPEKLFQDEIASFNQDYFIQYLFCGSLPSTQSPFVGIEFLPPGCRIFYRNKDVEFLHPSEVKTNVLQAVESSLKAKTANRKSAVIEYSGGLESNILLHAINRIDFDGRVNLVHITAHESGEVDDIAHVKKMARKFDCQLDIVNQLDCPPFQITSCTPNKPFFPNSGLVNSGFVNFMSSKALRQDSVVFNGSGGDSVFCACPQRWRPVELMRLGRPIDAARSLLDLSHYFRTPIVSTAMKSLAEYQLVTSKLVNPRKFFSSVNRAEEFAQASLEQKSFQFLPQQFPKGMSLSIKDRYINALIIKYDMQSSPLASIPGLYQFPFLTSESILSGLSIPASKLLKGKFNRYYLRQLASEKYNEPVFMQTRKGGVTGLTQKIIRDNKKSLEEFMIDSCFSDLKIIDPDRLRRTLNSVAAGATYCPRSIINLFSACLFIHQWRGRVRAGF
ncbi:hypothetical protein F7234_01115 [Pseudomonas putida]|uniref:asparagine synthase-related protein n=1 Tax=Pseudomonas putida TaxID=303 RepID=UPI00125FF4D8|nr:asparagine synthase-related protein [Pseudomonas putida]KAB5627010.1 hypothetical protein F7234_01115 [Pseudomonas putida]